MKPRINMITLGVRDLAASIDFYQNGLGLPRLGEEEKVAFFSLNGSWLGLFGYEALAEDAAVSSEGNGFRGFALAHNLESEAEVDALMAEVEAAGAVITKPPQATFWGGYSGYFHDPDGYLWEIAYNPFDWIGPKDP